MLTSLGAQAAPRPCNVSITSLPAATLTADGILLSRYARGMRDAAVLARYIAGVTGNALTAGLAPGAGAPRTNADEIAAYIEAGCPFAT